MRRYYQELELGQLEPEGVAASVWDALTALLGRDARALAAIQPQAPAAAPMFREANVDYDRPLGSSLDGGGRQSRTRSTACSA